MYEHLKNVTTLSLDGEKCIRCELCIEVCPREVFKIVDSKLHINNKDHCIECGACSKNCPTNAISVTTGVGCAAALLGDGCCGEGDCCGDGGCCS